MVSTDIEGPRSLMEQYDGYLCPDSEEGLYSAMLAFTRGEVPVMNIDYAQRNANVLARFEAILSD